jgi:hypothetical protein
MGGPIGAGFEVARREVGFGVGFGIGAHIEEAEIRAEGGEGGEEKQFGRQIEVLYSSPKIYPFTT